MGRIVFTTGFEEVLESSLKNSKFISEYTDKETYTDRILSKFNEKNSKYGVREVIFRETLSSEVDAFKYSGIVEDSETEEILAYIFISQPNMKSRNIFCAQQVFPGLSRIIESYIDESFYSLANKPIYFINTTLDNITNSMLGSLISLHVMGVRCIDLIDDRIDLSNYDNLSLREFTKYFSYKEDIHSKIISTAKYKFSYGAKNIEFSVESFESKNPIGSADRFFVIPSYAAVTLARKERINIDVSAVEEYLKNIGRGKSNLKPFVDFANKMNK